MFSSPLRTPLVALITYVAIGSITPAVSAAPNAVVKPSTSNSNVDVDGLKNPNLKVTTTISNTGGETLKLLNDHRGVLDPFPEDSFTITDPSGSRLSSRGERANYNSASAAGLDDPSDFTVLGPGDSVNVTHDLSSAYDFTHSGAGDYSFEPSNLFAYIDGDGTPKELPATVEGIAKVNLSGDLAVSPPAAEKPPTFANCTKTQQAKLRAAGEAAHPLIVEAYNYLLTMRGRAERYTNWFGPHDLDRWKVVEKTLRQMSASDQFTRLKYICGTNCSHLESDTVLYVNRGNKRDMWLCPPFWEELPETQVLGLIHEASHSCGTKDIEYGDVRCEILAEDNPWTAVHNADNYLYFVDNIPYLD